MISQALIIQMLEIISIVAKLFFYNINTITVEVEDDNSVGALGGEEVDTFTFEFTIEAVNTAPTLDSAMADYTIQVDSTYDYPISDASDVDSGDTFSHDVHELGGYTLPDFMYFNNRALELELTPDDNEESGDYDIEVLVEDNNSVGDPNGDKSVTTTFRITVTPLNHACVLDTTGITTSGYEFQIGEDQLIELPSVFTDRD